MKLRLDLKISKSFIIMPWTKLGVSQWLSVNQLAWLIYVKEEQHKNMGNQSWTTGQAMFCMYLVALIWHMQAQHDVWQKCPVAKDFPDLIYNAETVLDFKFPQKTNVFDIFCHVISILD